MATWRLISESDKQPSRQLLLGWRDMDGADHSGEGYYTEQGWCAPSIDLWNSKLPTHCMEIPPLPVTAGKRKTKKCATGYSAEFENSVWMPYPRKEGTSKHNAFQKFERLSPADKEMLILAIPIYARMKTGTDIEKVKHPEFFIRGRIFETLGVAKPAAVQSDLLSVKAVEPDWDSILKAYRMTGNWKQSYGPPPGLPGCRIPPEMKI